MSLPHFSPAPSTDSATPSPDLFINRPATQYVGMFGGTSGGATNIIRNVGLVNMNITGGFQTGGLVAHTGASVENCYTTGQVTSGSNNVGGLVGLSAGSVSNSYSTATVNGNTWVGGLVGTLYTGGSITNSYSTGAVSGTSSVGGLVGYNFGVWSHSKQLLGHSDVRSGNQ